MPILDLQYAIAWRARERGQTGVRLPERPTGKRIAIVGGGPAGISAAMQVSVTGGRVKVYVPFRSVADFDRLDVIGTPA